MVGLFVRLKLRLLANGLRMGPAYVIGFVLLAVLGAVGGSLVAVALAAGGDDAIVVTYAGMFLGWLVLPVVLSAADETLEPSRLLLFPLRRGQVVRGLFAAGFVGVGPAVCAIALAGAVVGAARRGGAAGAAAGVLGAACQLALCVAASRALTTALSAALRSRRGRDLAAGAVVLVGLLPVASNLVLGRLMRGRSSADAVARVAAVVRWSPPGLAAHAATDAAAGRPWVAVAELVAAAGCAGLLVLAWAAALARVTVRQDASSSASSVRARRGLLSWLGNRGRAGAVAARDLRYQWRDPRRRVLWVQVVVLLVFVLGPAARAAGGLMVAGVAFVGSVLSVQAAQQFGYDGPAFWMHVAATGARADVRSDLLGKAVASSAVTLPLLVTATVVGALLGGRTSVLAAAIVVELTAFGLGLAGATLLSVWFPVPLPDSSRNVFGNVDPGRGCLAGVAGLGMTVLTLCVAAGVAVPLLRIRSGPALVAVSIAALTVALVAGMAARAVAARLAFGRLPELLAAVTPRGG